MKKDNVGILLALAVAFIATAQILNGFVLAKLWGWFMVPVFGLPELNIVAAIGVSLVVSSVSHQYTQGDNPLAVLAFTFVNPILLLLTGWIVSLFM